MFIDENGAEHAETETEATITAAKELLASQHYSLKAPENPEEEIDIIELPEGRTLHSVKALVDEYRTRPERRVGTATHFELGSFIAHVNRFKDEHSAVFARPDPSDARVLAVLDYHQKGAAGEPRFGRHRSLYQFPLSDEWQAWTSKAGQSFEQAAFAAFLEDRIADVCDPSNAKEDTLAFAEQLQIQLASPSKLMELSRGLSVHVDQRVTTATNLASGEAVLAYEESHTDKTGAPLKVPGGFLLAIPVFKSGALYVVPCRLRYRVRNGSVTWSYTLHRTDRVFDHAIGEALDRVAKETELPVFRGTPE